MPSISRASSDISIKTTPNKWVELQLPGQPIQRALSDDTGQVQFWIYFQGPAHLKCENTDLQIEIKADNWVDAVHQSNNEPIQCP